MLFISPIASRGGGLKLVLGNAISQCGSWHYLSLISTRPIRLVCVDEFVGRVSGTAMPRGMNEQLDYLG